MKSKAAVMIEPWKMETMELDIPKLEPGCALIRIELSGICGTDKHSFKGENKQYWGTAGEFKAQYPFIGGHETVGIIEDITPEGAKNLEYFGKTLKKGDRVVVIPDLYCGDCYYCRQMPFYPWCDHIEGHGNISLKQWPYLNGGWSQYLVTKPNTDLFLMPDDASPEVGSLLEIFVVAMTLDKVKEFYNFAGEGLGFGDNIAVYGVGALGLAHVIHARQLGVDKIIAIDKSQFRLDMAKRFGADIILNVNDTTQQERLEIVRTATDGKGVDISVGAAGDPTTFNEGVTLLRKVGTYIEVGQFVDLGDVKFNPHLLLSRNLRLVGVSDHPTFGYDPMYRMLERYKDVFPIQEMITDKFSLDNAQAALERALADDVMKVTFDPWKN